MAKQQGPFKTFDIPTNALARTAPKEDSTAWMRKQALEHGSTDEQKLEKRRKWLSNFLISMKKHCDQLQLRKKMFLVDSQKREKEALAAIEKAEPKSDEAAKCQQQLSNLLMFREQQLTQFEMLINQQMYQMAMLDGQCLCVDVMSIQIRGVEGKGGKKGTIRASAAVYAMDAAQESARIYRRMRKLCDALMVKYGIQLTTDYLDPETGKDADPEDYGEQEPDEYEDEDVVDEADVKRIKKEVEGDDEFTG